MDTKKSTLLKISDVGNLVNMAQEYNIEYLLPVGSVTPKVAMQIRTTDVGDGKPRTFRTDKPEILRKIIKSLCQALYLLEKDIGVEEVLQEDKERTLMSFLR